MKRSLLELQMEGQIRDAGLPFAEIEYRFDPKRMFRFDFAWPGIMVALEVEGGIYNGGRHVTPKGFENDCDKYNSASCLGWRVLRVTAKMINDFRAIKYLSEIMGIEYDNVFIEPKKKSVTKSKKVK